MRAAMRLEQSRCTLPEFVLETRPNARIAVLYQNDEFGKDYLVALRKRLGAKASSWCCAGAAMS